MTSAGLLVLIAGIAVVLVLTSGRGNTPLPSYPPGSSPAVALSDLTPPQLAVAKALARDPRFAGAVPYAPEYTVGQRAWYKVNVQQAGAITVVVGIGWGDCTRRCEFEHRWTYLSHSPGQLYQSFEEGDQLPAVPASPDSGPAHITALLGLGPACPFPPVASPICANMPIGGATVRAASLDDPTMIEARSDPRGLAVLTLPAGLYLLSVDIGPSANIAPPAPIVIRLASGGGASLRLYFRH
jgi:hypothetical protein